MRKLNAAVGAEIEGFEPRMPLDDDTVRDLRAAFDDRGVLVFRNLDLDEDMQRYLVFSLLGEGMPDPEDRAEKTPMLVSNKEKNGAAPYGRLLFHCDNMWARRQQPIISLYGLEVEQPTAPTMFVSMGDAWDRLPDDLRGSRREPRGSPRFRPWLPQPWWRRGCDRHRLPRGALICEADRSASPPDWRDHALCVRTGNDRNTGLGPGGE